MGSREYGCVGRLSVGVLWVAAACGLAVGCGGNGVTGTHDGGVTDGGHDAGRPSDGGHPHDGGSHPDGAPHPEGGPAPDGGPDRTPKVDLLFDIDNSASMVDKEELLAQAIPDLVSRLVQPDCVVTKMGVITTVGRSVNGSCAAHPGSTIEFAPVHDMHVGVISSSLGTRGVTSAGQVCSPTAMTGAFPSDPALPAHDDDRAELLSRTASDPYKEGTSKDSGGQSFLDWFPTGAGWSVNAGKSPTVGPQALTPPATPLGAASQLEKDFEALLLGAHTYGCGIESQIETWYRFLVQPDPYDAIVVGTGGLAIWSGVDATLLKQRHDFLRPDSVVAIVDLSDENDSEIDVRSFGGQGYLFMDAQFQPPRGTSACATTPGAPGCTSCAYSGHASDPSCKLGSYSAADDPGFYINVRHVHMQAKYGISPQFPLERYVLGLTSPKVPDRAHEYPKGASAYQGGTAGDPADLACTNPLFAATLPDGSDLTLSTLCNVAGAGGPRTASGVFYLHIGGVPHQLLQQNPSDPNSPQKDTLAASDWQAMLGKDPEVYDYTGIDPHMIEAFAPRAGLPVLTTGPNATGGGPDPVNGGEWVTNGLTPPHSLPVDREYACIFPLPKPRDCTSSDYSVQDACDCAAGLALDAVPSVCGLKNPSAPYASGTNDYTTQYFGRAYPTIRELDLARMLGPQGVVSSMCPIHTVDDKTGSDPLYGYRPAVTSLVNRMKAALAL